jgi:CheY-like chemotaxis protein
VIVSAVFAAGGFPVITHIIAPQADWLAQVHQAAPAAVLLDRRLASDRTWEIVRRLKQDSAMQDMPILFYTLAPEDNAGSLLELDYRVKPLESDQLAHVLKSSTQDRRKTILIVDDDPHAWICTRAWSTTVARLPGVPGPSRARGAGDARTRSSRPDPARLDDA